ncbi:hypothetical protein GQ54DRAFT_312592 [Martensiomyces pterosporus]|nr:hypothetical protein GQ54DRAFT_312592 [Martensiomyces pterosporus]
MSEINKPLFRKYRGELNALTFNSRPIINRLTTIAGENKREAATILKAIEEHLSMTSATMKLPAFYLLDSIAKNVGDIYLHLLSSGMVKRMFMKTWCSVGDNVKKEMERVLKTWRDGFQGGGKNLFQPFVLKGIDEELARLKAQANRVGAIPTSDGVDLLDKLTNTQAYARKRSLDEQRQAMKRAAAASNGAKAAASVPPEKRPRPQPTQAKEPRNQRLLQDVNRIMLKKQVEQLRKPNDPLLYDVVTILSRIKQLVTETVLPDDQVAIIRQQLADIDGNGNGSSAAGISSLPASAPAAMEAERRSTTPPYSPPPHVLSAAVGSNANGKPQSAAAAAAAAAATAASVNKPKPQADPNLLVQNLLASPELINSLSKIAPSITSLLGGAGGGTGSRSQPQFPYESYTRFAQLEPIPLTHASIIRSRPGIHSILYKGYPNVCKQCGWRSDDSELGLKKMEQHLDWHFRRNRRSQQDRVRKANARGWYVGRGGWEAAATDEEAASGSAGAAGSGISRPGQTADALFASGLGGDKAAGPGAKLSGGNGSGSGSPPVEKLREQTVIVSTDNNNRPCPICKEHFERRFNEEEEEWEFVNAVLVDGAVYHATCRADLADAAVPAAAVPSPGASIAG